MAGDVALRHPVTPQGCGDVAGVGRHDGFEPIGLCGRVLGGCPRSLVVLLQNRNRRVTLLGERDDVDEQIAALLGVGEQLEAVRLDCPRVVQLAHDLVDWAQACVASCLVRGEFGGA